MNEKQTKREEWRIASARLTWAVESYQKDPRWVELATDYPQLQERLSEALAAFDAYMTADSAEESE